MTTIRMTDERLTDSERLAVLVAHLRTHEELVIRFEHDVRDAFTISRLGYDDTVETTHETIGTGVTLYDAIDNAHYLHWRQSAGAVARVRDGER